MWGHLIDRYREHLAAAGRPQTTIGLRTWQLDHLSRGLGIPLSEVTTERLIGFLAQQDWAPETRKSYRSAVRGFCAWAMKTGIITHDPAVDLPPVRVPRASARPCPEATYAAALGRADARGKLMLRLAAEAGLRRAEIARIHSRDLVHTATGPSLVVHGKGDHIRIVPITDSLAALILDAGGWVFPSIRGKHLEPKTIGMMCSRLLGDHVTVHQLRHRFASRAYRGTHNLRAVQELLGHSTLATTERYLDCSEDERRTAMLAAITAA